MKQGPSEWQQHGPTRARTGSGNHYHTQRVWRSGDRIPSLQRYSLETSFADFQYKVHLVIHARDVKSLVVNVRVVSFTRVNLKIDSCCQKVVCLPEHARPLQPYKLTRWPCHSCRSPSRTARSRGRTTSGAPAKEYSGRGFLLAAADGAAPGWSRSLGTANKEFGIASCFHDEYTGFSRIPVMLESGCNTTMEPTPSSQDVGSMPTGWWAFFLFRLFTSSFAVEFKTWQPNPLLMNGKTGHCVDVAVVKQWRIPTNNSIEMWGLARRWGQHVKM